MSVLASRLDPGNDVYRANRSANLRLLEELAEQLAKSRAGGGPRYVERHRARGKLLARERVELLLDRDAAFLELSPLAAWAPGDARSRSPALSVHADKGASAC
jgi:acyl-CoA carboxylase subunit beta